MPVLSINPASMGHAPVAYTNGMHVVGTHETLYIAGQTGGDANGVTSPDFETQARQVWSNVAVVLAEAGMTMANIVKTTIFLVDRADFPKFVEVRTAALQGAKPASSLIFVASLARPEWKVEVEAIAVK